MPKHRFARIGAVAILVIPGLFLTVRLLGIRGVILVLRIRCRGSWPSVTGIADYEIERTLQRETVHRPRRWLEHKLSRNRFIEVAEADIPILLYPERARLRIEAGVSGHRVQTIAKAVARLNRVRKTNRLDPGETMVPVMPDEVRLYTERGKTFEERLAEMTGVQRPKPFYHLASGRGRFPGSANGLQFLEGLAKRFDPKAAQRLPDSFGDLLDMIDDEQDLGIVLNDRLRNVFAIGQKDRTPLCATQGYKPHAGNVDAWHDPWLLPVVRREPVHTLTFSRSRSEFWRVKLHRLAER